MNITQLMVLIGLLVIGAVLGTGYVLGPGRSLFLPPVPTMDGVEVVRLTIDGLHPELGQFPSVCAEVRDSRPRVSPDGHLAAYVVGWFDPGTYRQTEQVLVAPAADLLGREDIENENRTLCWSPEGQRLAYLHHDLGRQELVVTRADGEPTMRVALSAYRETSAPRGGFHSLTWSPAGDRIGLLWQGYSPETELAWRVYVLDLDSRVLRLAAERTGNGAGFLTSPWGDDATFIPLRVSGDRWAIALTSEARAGWPRSPISVYESPLTRPKPAGGIVYLEPEQVPPLARLDASAEALREEGVVIVRSFGEMRNAVSEQTWLLVIHAEAVPEVDLSWLRDRAAEGRIIIGLGTSLLPLALEGRVDRMGRVPEAKPGYQWPVEAYQRWSKQECIARGSAYAPLKLQEVLDVTRRILCPTPRTDPEPWPY